jgi:hypothetical protein
MDTRAMPGGRASRARLPTSASSDAALIELAHRARAEAARVPDRDDGEAGDRLFRALRALQPRTTAGAHAKAAALIALGTGPPP